jgi:hypothetical protein
VAVRQPRVRDREASEGERIRVNGPRNLLTLGRAIFPTWRVGDQPFS